MWIVDLNRPNYHSARWNSDRDLRCNRQINEANERSCIRTILDEAGSRESRGRGPSGCWERMMFARDPHVMGRAVRASWDGNTRLRFDIEVPTQRTSRWKNSGNHRAAPGTKYDRLAAPSENVPRARHLRDYLLSNCTRKGGPRKDGQLTGYTIPSDCNPSHVD